MDFSLAMPASIGSRSLLKTSPFAVTLNVI